MRATFSAAAIDTSTSAPVRLCLRRGNTAEYYYLTPDEATALANALTDAVDELERGVT